MTNFEKLHINNGELDMDVIVSPTYKTLILNSAQVTTVLGISKTLTNYYLGEILKDQKLDKFNQEIANFLRQEKVGHEFELSIELSRKNSSKVTYSISDNRVKLYCLEVVESIASKLGITDASFLREKLENYLEEHGDSQKVIIYNNGTESIEILTSPGEETVWLRQEQIAKLYGTTRENVSMHIRNILEDKELDQSICKDFLHVGSNGQAYSSRYYNLDMILAVGYRTKTKIAINFRKWVSRVIKDYLLKGAAYNAQRLEAYKPFLGENAFLIDKQIEHFQTFLKILATISENIRILEPKSNFEAEVEIRNILTEANKKVTIVDRYFNYDALYLLTSIGKNVEVEIITGTKAPLDEHSIRNMKFGFKKTNVYRSDDFHDRYIIIDDTYVYAIGESLKDAGNKIFNIVRFLEKDKIEKLISAVNSVK